MFFSVILFVGKTMIQCDFTGLLLTFYWDYTEVDDGNGMICGAKKRQSIGFRQQK